jgi:hypothetical protein
MALTITATITVNDDQPFTPLEARIIAAMQAHPSSGSAITEAETPAPVEAPAPAVEKPRRTRTPKAAPAPEAAESTTPAVLDTTLDETPAEAEAPVEAEAPAPAEEDLLGGETKEYTLEDALAAATVLLKAGRQADVKATIASASGGTATRVSELKGAHLGAFITALESL